MLPEVPINELHVALPEQLLRRVHEDVVGVAPRAGARAAAGPGRALVRAPRRVQRAGRGVRQRHVAVA